MDRAEIDVLLEGLEKLIKRRGRHRGAPVFYQMLEYDLAPILQIAEDDAYVRAQVREMLVRHRHAPEPPARGHVVGPGDFAHLPACAGKSGLKNRRSLGSDLCAAAT